jgi:hypothetical protein
MNTKPSCDIVTFTLRVRRAFALMSLTAMAGLTVNGLPARAADDGAVDVGGEHVLTVYYPAGGLSVKQRADKVTERLVTILGDPRIKPSDVQALGQGKGEARIMVKNTLLYTVDMQTAKRNSTTPLKLAQSYVAHLRDLLPRINVKPNPNNGAPVTGDPAPKGQ